MAKIRWIQTFRNAEGVTVSNAPVSIYLAGTSTAVRVFDVDDNLTEDAPQQNTDGHGRIAIYLDPDDFSTGQLFDTVCSPGSLCGVVLNEIRLNSLMIFRDTEGGRSFKNIFVQATVPTAGMQEGDPWLETDDGNELHIYENGNWVSRRDGKIATAVDDQTSGTGVNVCHARYSSFEEITKPPTTSANGTVTLDSGIGFFGNTSLKLAASAADHRCYLGETSTDYNVKITPNQKWIISTYNCCNGIEKDIDLYIKTEDAGTHYKIDCLSHGTADTWKRVSGIVDLTADDSTQCIIRVDNDGGNGINMWFDGIMFEAQTGSLEIPSVYTLPSAIIQHWDSQADNTGTAIKNATASILSNWNLTISDMDKRPAGIYPVDSITDFSQMDFLDSVKDSIKILSTPDTSVAYGFSAIPIDDKQRYTIVIRHKSSVASTSGLMLRFNQYNTNLPAGKTHIGSAGGTNTQTRTNYLTLFSGAMPDTSWIVNSYTYTPTAGTKYASFSMYNWNPNTAGVEYRVDYVLMYPIPKTADEVPETATRKWAGEAGADVTSVNFQPVDWLTEAVAGVIPLANTLAKCIIPEADETEANEQPVNWLTEAIAGVLPVANTSAKCTDPNADETEANEQPVNWLTEAIAGVLPVANTSAKCTDPNADETSANEANDTVYINGSVNQVAQGNVQINDDLQLNNGVDISFYNSSAYKGGIYGDLNGVLISGTNIVRIAAVSDIYLDASGDVILYSDVIPNTSGLRSVGTTVKRLDNVVSEKLNISTDDITMATADVPCRLHIWDTGSSSWVEYDMYITKD